MTCLFLIPTKESDHLATTLEIIDCHMKRGLLVLLFYFIKNFVKIIRRLKYMNKTELVTAMAEKSELSKKDAEKVLTTFVDIIKDTLSNGDKLTITGFGSFEVVERAERQGRNPATNEPILIKASKAPKFKASKALKSTVNGGE